METNDVSYKMKEIKALTEALNSLPLPCPGSIIGPQLFASVTEGLRQKLKSLQNEVQNCKNLTYLQKAAQRRQKAPKASLSISPDKPPKSRKQAM